MVKQTVEERRSTLRAKRVLSIELRIFKSTRKHIDRSWYLTTTQDMSLGGIAFYSEREYCAGDIVELRVIMSGVLDIFKGLAKVVRIDKKEMGAFYLVAVKFISNEARRSNRSVNHPVYRSGSKPSTKSSKRV